MLGAIHGIEMSDVSEFAMQDGQARCASPAALTYTEMLKSLAVQFGRSHIPFPRGRRLLSTSSRLHENPSYTKRAVKSPLSLSYSSNSPPLPGFTRWSTASFWIILVSITGAAAAGYVTQSLISAYNSSPAFTLIDSKRAKTIQNAHQPSYGGLGAYVAAIGELEASWKAKGYHDRVSTDPSDLEAHGISEWSYHPAKRPSVVVWVENTEEVREIVRIALKYRIPVTPFSGGTSLEGHFSSPYGGISVDMSLMDKILRISEDDGDCVVQPGVKWEDLNEHLAKEGVPLFFPLDPGPGATIGGMAGTGCSGTNAVRYGTAKAEWFINLTVVLPSGEIIKTRSDARKSSAGWDATKLFIGAEGTLGIVTEATLRLAPLLPTKCAVATFPSVEDAVRAATEVVNGGMPVREFPGANQKAVVRLLIAECVEFLDAKTMGAINDGGLAGRRYSRADSLFFKFQGSDSLMSEVSQNVQKTVIKHGGKNLEFSQTDKEAQALWQGRKAALWSVMALREGCRVWTTDVCVPISKIAALVRETSEDFDRRGILACHFGHVGDGNVHSLALFSNEQELKVVEEGVHDMVHRAIRLGGTCTGEHGVGIGKVEYLERELGEGTVGLMETVKRALDPLNLFNPGKIYPNIKPIQP